MMSGTSISPEAINIIAQRATGRYLIQGGHVNEGQRRIAEWFRDIIRGSAPYPLERIRAEGNDMSLIPQNHEQFLSALLMFWTSVRNYNSNFTYVAAIGTRTLASHTCSQQIDLPTNYATLEDLYVRLITSVPSTGFQYA